MSVEWNIPPAIATALDHLGKAIIALESMEGARTTLGWSERPYYIRWGKNDWHISAAIHHLEDGYRELVG